MELCGSNNCLSFDSTSSFTVGTDGTNFIKGFIDEVKFYNYARTSDQIKQIITVEEPPKAPLLKSANPPLTTSTKAWLVTGKWMKILHDSKR